MEVIYRKTEELVKLENNPRTITQEQLQKLKESIQSNPDYFEARPIILSDRTGELVIIAGNQRYDACVQLGIREVPTVLIPNLTEEREREIIIRDNVSNGEWDMSRLLEWDCQKLMEWGVDLDFGVEDITEEVTDEAKYTKKIDAPIYTPTMEEKPSVSSLCNTLKYEELVEEIKEKNLPHEVEEFLLLAATRHIVFDYGEIAEYYAHADKETQRLFENSALVIIDFDKAIELGYAKIRADIYDIMEEDLDDEE